MDARLGGAAIGYNMLLTPFGAMVGPPLFGGLVDRTGGYGLGWLAAAGLVLAGTLVFAAAFAERVSTPAPSRPATAPSRPSASRAPRRGG